MISNKNIAILIISLTFIWVGLLSGISFLEAPLKFNAPGITLELGLGIGKLVFGALTKIEMIISILLGTSLIIIQTKKRQWVYFAIPITIVIIDNFYLMPILDARIDMITNGIKPPISNAHWTYVILEIIKLLSLIVAGIKFMKERIR